ncbi:MAG: efflux RND transporter permease subunit [Alphaproteobacteria bacterium]
MIKWFAKHPIAPNLLMVSIFMLALVMIPNLQKATFPDIPERSVSISVSWQGTSATEIEDAICKPLEQNLESIENIESYSCTASEDSASSRVTMNWGANYDDFYEDVKSAVDQTSFPSSSDTPKVTKYQSGFQTTVAILAVTGIDNLMDLKDYTEDLKNQIVALNGVSSVTVSGFDDIEFLINLKPERIEALKLSVSDVASALQTQSVEQTLGQLKSINNSYSLKIQQRATDVAAFEDMIIMTLSDGAIIRLKDVADITQNFSEPKPKSLIDGKAAGFITIERTESQDIINVANTVYDFVERVQKTAPAGIKIDVVGDVSRMTRDRLNLVVHNGINGLFLAFFTLWLFFNIRYSFWITIGLPISFAGGLVLMLWFGQTINIMSLVGLLVAIGILMDDAIVVAENIQAQYLKGKSKSQAAIDGTLEVMPGVISSFFTTIMIALAVSFLQGEMGATLRVIPIAMIMVLIISLVEAFLILPAHLGHSLRDREEQEKVFIVDYITNFFGVFITIGALSVIIRGLLETAATKSLVTIVIVAAILGFIATLYGRKYRREHNSEHQKSQQPFIRRNFYKGFYFVRDHIVHKIAAASIKHKLITICVVVSFFLSGHFLLSWGIVRFTSFPAVEGSRIEARILYPSGFSQEAIEPGIQQLLNGFDKVKDDYKNQFPDAPELAESITVQYGVNRDSSDSGEHQATIGIDLNDIRSLSADEVAAIWRKETGSVADVLSLNILQNAPGPGGDDLAIRVFSKNDDSLLNASLALEEFLMGTNGIKSVIHDLRAGAPEWTMTFKPLALELGLSTSDISSQLRHALFGFKVDEIQVANDTVDAYIRYGGLDTRSVNLLENLLIKTSSGAKIPLTSLVSIEQSYSPTRISRRNGSRVNTVKASLDKTILLDTEAESIVRKQFINGIGKDFEDVSFGFGGRREDRMKTMSSMQSGFLLGLFGIYAILALQFRSWLQPLAVMLIIPMGYAGTLWGHFLLGLNFSTMSMIGVVLLSGVAVNDSILLVTFIKNRIREGYDLRQAASLAAKERYRAVFLTSLTTVAGVLPLLLETDIQAQIIKPLAVSIAFGLMSTTTMVLFLAPTLFVIIEEGKEYIQKLLKPKEREST